MKSLMVIGGTGFFGKSILDAYKRGLLDSWNVRNIKIIARTASNLKVSHPNLVGHSVELYDLDISTVTEIPYADYVIHAAASTDASKYTNQASIEKRNIQAGACNYSRLAQKYHRKSKILYCSSGAIYGQQPHDLLEIPESYIGSNLHEMALNKQDYSLAKIEAELLIQNLRNIDLNVSIARCFSFIGPYLPLDQHFAIGNFIRDGLRGGPITVKAKGTVYRSYLYADDLVQWLMRILQISSNDCPIFNVGSDEAISIQDLAKKLADNFNAVVSIQHIPSAPVDRYIPSIEKARSIGCEIDYTLDKAIEKTVTFLLKCTDKLSS
jgi:dTDP-glucose 4,6-dehydratase